VWYVFEWAQQILDVVVEDTERLSGSLVGLPSFIRRIDDRMADGSADGESSTPHDGVSDSSPLLKPSSIAATSCTSASDEMNEIHEWPRKLVMSCLQALLALKNSGFVHGDIRPCNIYYDVHHVVKLLFIPRERQNLPLPYRAPEFGPESSGPYVPTWAGDMFALGVSISEVAFGVTNVEMDRGVTMDEMLIDFLVQATRPDPLQRMTLAQALQHPLLPFVRLVNGVAIETMLSRVHAVPPNETVEDLAEDGMVRYPAFALTRVTAQTGLAASILLDDKDSSLCLQPSVFGAGDVSMAHVGPSDAALRAMEGGGAVILHRFFAEHGPAFQVVRSGCVSMTLYSIKSDPRRQKHTRPRASFNSEAM
jgi:hypothetical protein